MNRSGWAGAERVERRECWVGFATCGCEVPKIEIPTGAKALPPNREALAGARQLSCSLVAGSSKELHEPIVTLPIVFRCTTGLAQPNTIGPHPLVYMCKYLN